MTDKSKEGETYRDAWLVKIVRHKIQNLFFSDPQYWLSIKMFNGKETIMVKNMVNKSNKQKI